MSLSWEKRKVKEKGVIWFDYFSTDGHWWIAEGFDEYARKNEGKPYTLMYRSDTSKDGKWRAVDTFASIRGSNGAKACAEEEAE